ncbi:hypothetical protein M9458_036629, partial [Cirrhinus mrigala]
RNLSTMSLLFVIPGYPPDPPWPSGLCTRPWFPELPDPPWPSGLYTRPWLPELLDLPWPHGLYTPPWLPELPDPPWHPGLSAPLWLPELPDPPWDPVLSLTCHGIPDCMLSHGSLSSLIRPGGVPPLPPVSALHELPG